MGIANSFKGYETVFAALRMFLQMLYRLAIAALIVQVIVCAIYIYINKNRMYGPVSTEDICLFRTYAMVRMTYNINPNRAMAPVEYTCEGEPISLEYGKFIYHFEPYVLQRYSVFISKTSTLLIWTSLIYLLLPVLMIFFSKKHKQDSLDKYLRGATFVSSETLKKLIEEKSSNEFKFRISDNIQIPLGIINRHCITLGRPGTGKTQLIIRIIEQIIQNGFRAVIHDFKGDFITTFYDYKKHYIFNPLDKRHMGLKDYEIELIDDCAELRISDMNESILSKYSKRLANQSSNDKVIPIFKTTELLDIIPEIVENISEKSKHKNMKDKMYGMKRGIHGWSIFNELKSSIDIDAFCASLIPESASQDNFWPISSRQLLGSIISYCIHNGIKSYAELWKLVNLGNEQLLELFKTTPGCEEGTKLLTEAKTANNILAVMSNYTKPIKYLIGTEGDFSIKDWVMDSESDRKIVFLSNYAMIQETIRPFLTLYADFSIKTLLSLDDDLNRRLFFILDEFGELGKIGTIVPLLTGSRSKGGAGIILIQDTARINSIYGQDGCSTIVNSCGNLISFAVKKAEADFASECFGSMEIKRTEESKSMGVDNISDSISISKQTVEKRLVMPSEVTNIPTLNFYIQLTDYPVSRDKLDIVSYGKRANAYIGREDLLFKSPGSQHSGEAAQAPTVSQNLNAEHPEQVRFEHPEQTKEPVEDALFSETRSKEEPSISNPAHYFGDLEPSHTEIEQQIDIPEQAVSMHEPLVDGVETEEPQQEIPIIFADNPVSSHKNSANEEIPVQEPSADEKPEGGKGLFI